MRLVCLGVLLACAVSACDAVHTPTLAPAAAEAAIAAPDLRPHVGAAYAEFAAAPEMHRYTLEQLGLSADEQSRFHTDASALRPGAMINGGGAEALVFGGCAASGCADGVAVLAVDSATGDAFVAVRDASGSEVLAPNDRLEALLRLNSPQRRWDDPDGWSEQTASAGP